MKCKKPIWCIHIPLHKSPRGGRQLLGSLIYENHLENLCRFGSGANFLKFILMVIWLGYKHWQEEHFYPCTSEWIFIIGIKLWPNNREVRVAFQFFINSHPEEVQCAWIHVNSFSASEITTPRDIIYRQKPTENPVVLSEIRTNMPIRQRRTSSSSSLRVNATYYTQYFMGSRWSTTAQWNANGLTTSSCSM